MKKDWLLLFWILCFVGILAGCELPGKAKTFTETKTTVTEKDRVTVTESKTKSYIKQPSNPLNDASIIISNQYAQATVPGAQSKAEIDRARFAGWATLLSRSGCILIMLLGGVVLFAGEKLLLDRTECNRDGSVLIGIGLGGLCILQWVEDSGPVMKFVLPTLIVGVVVYYIFVYRKRNSSIIKTNILKN